MKEESTKSTCLPEEKTNLQKQKISSNTSKYKKVDNGIPSRKIGAEIYVVVIFILAAIIGLFYVAVSIFNLL